LDQKRRAFHPRPADGGYRDDSLVIVNRHDKPAKEPRILCSIGLAP
jgi:hypothetical protein